MGTHLPLLKGSHTRAHTPKQGPSLPWPQCGFVLPAKSLLFRHAFVYIHFPVLCEPSLSATALSQTIFHRVFQLLVQTAHVRFHERKWVHTRLSEKDRTQRHTRRNRGCFGWGAIITLDTSCTFTNIPGPGVRTAYFAALGSWPGGALEERRKPSGQRCAYACRCSEGVAAPLGFSLLLKLHLCAPRSGLSTLARCGGVTTALGMLCALSKCSVRSFQNGLHLCPHSGVGNIPTFPQRIAHNVSHVEGGSFSSEATVASDLPSDFYKYVNCINNSACRFCCNCFCGMVR